MKHNFPPSAMQVTAHTNIDHVLDSIERTDTEVGAWVNVIGYLTSPPAGSGGGGRGKRKKIMMKQSKRESQSQERDVYVNAIVLYSTGPLKLDIYERSLERRQRSELGWQPGEEA